MRSKFYTVVALLALAIVSFAVVADLGPTGCTSSGTVNPEIVEPTVATVQLSCEGLALWCDGDTPLLGEAACQWLVPGCQLAGVAVAQILNNLSKSKGMPGELPPGFLSSSEFAHACFVQPISGCDEATAAYGAGFDVRLVFGLGQ